MLLAMSSHSALDNGVGAGAHEKLIGQPLSFNAPAAAYVIDYLQRQRKSGSAIRIAAVHTHCTGGRGFGYSIAQDSERSGDTIVESDGLRLLADRESVRRLKGAQIDYEDVLHGGGLVVNNPNAIGKCHCGRHDVLDAQEGAEAEEC